MRRPEKEGFDGGITSALPYSGDTLSKSVQRKSLWLAVLGMAGCGAYTQGVRPTEKPAPDSAYLYGRFTMRAEKSLVGTYPTMGLMLACSDGEKYTVGLSIEQPLQVLKIRPARCELAEIIGTDRRGDVHLRRRPKPAWIHPDDFQAGKMYYVGDFLGAAAQENHWKVIYTEAHLVWALDPIQDRLATTTAEMKSAFPSLASLPVVDRRLVPAPPPLPPGPIGAAISPARAARIAPFTKRLYGSTKDCETGCKMGQCVPFRDQQGHAAMTCIVRCKADGDCPAGLACNCVQTSGTACRIIAQLPDDAMEGLCLSPESQSEVN
jgi:hypothetical protein